MRGAGLQMKHPGLVIPVFIIALLMRTPGSAQEVTADQILAKAKTVYSQQGAKAALPEYERALTAYRQSGARLGEAITIGLIGNCYKRLGDYPKALEMLNTSLAMKRELHERLEEGKTLSNLGLVYWEQGAYPKAIQNFNESISIAQDLKNVLLEASALNNLSLVYDEQGDYRRSLAQYQKALELHRSINYEPGESDTLGNIGGVYLSLGRFSEAESYYRHSLEISRRLALKPSETQDLGNIALCQLGQGEIKEALETLGEALEIANSAGMFKESADWHRIRASAHLCIGRFDLAMSDYDSAELAYEHAGLKREEAEVLMDRGMAYFSLGDRLRAEKQIKRAMEISREIGYKRGFLADQLDLAEVELQTGHLLQAQHTAGSALAEAARLDEIDAQVPALLELARISLRLHHYPAAEVRAFQAQEKAHDGGLKLLEAEALILSGELELKERHPQEALLKLDAAKAISTQAGDVDHYDRFLCFGRNLQSCNRRGRDNSACN